MPVLSSREMRDEAQARKAGTSASQFNTTMIGPSGSRITLQLSPEQKAQLSIQQQQLADVDLNRAQGASQFSQNLDLQNRQLSLEQEQFNKMFGLKEDQFGLLSSTLQRFFDEGVPGFEGGGFSSAEQPLRDAIQRFQGLNQEAIGSLTRNVDLFRKGGSFGASSIDIAERQAMQTEQAGRAQLVSSGLSSSTAATGLKTRVASDLTSAKLGIEQERTGALSGALGQLANLQERTSTTATTGTAGLEAGISDVRVRGAETAASLQNSLLNSFNFNL